VRFLLEIRRTRANYELFREHSPVSLEWQTLWRRFESAAKPSPLCNREKYRDLAVARPSAAALLSDFIRDFAFLITFLAGN
jgi:hypothetical protein